ncbi:hypothetical protein Fcan01_10585 [Folsomia candida]|uniref:Uncharacterized protein n=1 Tax=Folsomia candida TaxID=158441 RepID=A0A226E7U7_FOLCA|nr:hypothetical protein Fcan01_10585 [Folsomia candida]
MKNVNRVRVWAQFIDNRREKGSRGDLLGSNPHSNAEGRTLHHKIFEGYIFNILSNFENNYFFWTESSSELKISFILDKVEGTPPRHKFPRRGESPDFNLISISTRYSDSCFILVADIYTFKFYLFLDDLLEGISYANLDPHFILIHTYWPAAEFLPVFRRHTPYWVSSTFLFWHEPSRNLYRICVSCREPIPISLTSPVVNRHSLRIVPPMEKSFAFISHHEGPPPPRRKDMTSCSFRPYWGLETWFPTCVVYVLSTHLNYSLVPQYPRQRSIAWVSFGESAGNVFYEEKFLSKSMIKFKLLNHATLRSEFVLVLYTEKGGNLDFFKLLEPLDFWIWAGLGIGFLVTFFLICGISEIKGNIGNALFTVFSVLLDQSQHAPKDVGNLIFPNKTTLLITTWTLTLSIISTCYKGDLFSYFVTETPPKTPDTLEALSKWGIPITTNTRYPGYREQMESTLKNYVLADLAQGDDPYAKLYARLADKTILLTGKVNYIVLNITQNLPLNTDRGLIKMPQTFASLSDKRLSDRMKTLMSRSNRYFTQEKPNFGGATSVVSRIPWYMDNNEYTGIIKKGLAKLWESGIYENWRKKS